MFGFKKKKLLVTHNGSFHADDVFAAATLSLILEKSGESFEIIRTRDEDIFKKADYIFDVGGIYDGEENKFDHHQSGGAGKRENGIEYAAFGLVWKKFGEELCGSKEAAGAIDKRLVAPVDATDNGFDLVEKKYEVFPYTIQDFFRVMRPTWRETDKNIDEMFAKCVSVAKDILLREIICAKDAKDADENIFSIYKNSNDKRVLLFDKNYASAEVLNGMPEVLFVVYPREVTKDWGVKAIRQDSKSFKNKKDFPENWAGLRDKDLQNITGVPDVIFCHRARFLCVAKTKEGAIALAKLALEN